MSKTNIKQGIENEDFSAFSDGLLLVAKNKEHAEQLTTELEEVKINGLKFNKCKSQIITSNQ